MLKYLLTPIISSVSGTFFWECDRLLMWLWTYYHLFISKLIFYTSMYCIMSIICRQWMEILPIRHSDFRVDHVQLSVQDMSWSLYVVTDIVNENFYVWSQIWIHLSQFWYNMKKIMFISASHWYQGLINLLCKTFILKFFFCVLACSNWCLQINFEKIILPRSQFEHDSKEVMFISASVRNIRKI